MINNYMEQFHSAASFAAQFFTFPQVKIEILDYSASKFHNPLTPSVTNGSVITFNRNWLNAGLQDSDDIPFFLIHELRHAYQNEQVRKLNAGEKVSEPRATIEEWQHNFQKYIYNRGDPESRSENIHQEIEMDANGYAMALLILMHINESWSPMIRAEEDMLDLSVERAELYLNTRPELTGWLNSHLKR